MFLLQNKKNQKIINRKKYQPRKNKKKLSTEKITSQNSCSYAYKLVCRVSDRFSKSIKIYRGENVAHNFIEAMLKEEKYCNKRLKKYFNKKIDMSEEDEANFKASIECHICNKKYKKIIKIKLEIMTIIQVNIWAVLIKNVIQNSITKEN